MIHQLKHSLLLLHMLLNPKSLNMSPSHILQCQKSIILLEFTQIHRTKLSRTQFRQINQILQRILTQLILQFRIPSRTSLLPLQNLLRTTLSLPKLLIIHQSNCTLTLHQIILHMTLTQHLIMQRLLS